MRSKLSLLVLAAAFCNFGLLAQERPRGAAKEPVRKETRSVERGTPRGEAAKDVTLPDDERMRARREELKRRFDGDGDGKLEPAEREQAKAWAKDVHEKRKAERHEAWSQAWERFQQEHPQAAKRVLEKADANGDGAVDEVERWKAMQALRDKRWTDREARQRWQEFEGKHPELAERMKERAEDRQELREDRRELREDRQERREDRRELREDRRELRQDLRDGDRKEVRQDLKELRDDRKELREDRRDVREDRRDVREDRRDLRNDKPAPKQPPARR